MQLLYTYTVTVVIITGISIYRSFCIIQYSIPVHGRIKETTWVYIQLNPSALGFNWVYTRHQRLRVQSKIHQFDFQLENSNNITSDILYNWFLIDRDSCSDIVGYFYDVAPGRMHKNRQGKLAQLLIYSPG